MGLWSFYFIVKVILYYMDYISFHFFANAAFAACLIFSNYNSRLFFLRRLLAIPIGIMLLYFDSPFPPIRNVIPKLSQLADFSFQYYLELITRVVGWQAILALLALLLIYYLLSKWLRMDTIAALAIVCTLLPLKANVDSNIFDGDGKTIGVASDAELSEALDVFFITEESRLGYDRKQKVNAPPFDVIVISVCSLAWDDLEYVKEIDNPFFQRFQGLFTSFNSASSYSGPSIIRLLRASRGQQDQRDLYKPPLDDALLFNNLKSNGYQTQLAMNHDGKYGDLLNEIRTIGGMSSPLFDNKKASPSLKGFDGSQVYDDYSVLSQWWDARMKMPNDRVALFYNTITLHDGNRSLDGRLENSVDTYSRRLHKLLGDMDRFYEKVNTSGRNVVIVFVPEHGAAIRRNKNEIVGMREVPGPNVTNIPVGILLTSKTEGEVKTSIIKQPSSYLAASELISRFISKPPFVGNSGKNNLDEYLKDLPTTRFVSENEDLVIMRFGASYYFRSNDINWNLYQTAN